MNKFSFIDSNRKRWDFEILADSKVKIGLPDHKVEHIVSVDFDPKVDFEGDQDMWIDWAFTQLVDDGVMEFDEWLGLMTPDEMEEARCEVRWEDDHIRSERAQLLH